MSFNMNNRHSSLLSENFVPESYRDVSVQPYYGDMTEDAIRKHLVGKESLTVMSVFNLIMVI